MKHDLLTFFRPTIQVSELADGTLMRSANLRNPFWLMLNVLKGLLTSLNIAVVLGALAAFGYGISLIL